MTILLLRTCRLGGTSYNGFRWPLTVGATVEAPDWDPRPMCGGGLHGLPYGEGDGSLLDWSPDAMWMAVEADRADVVEFGGKAKARRVVVRAVGSRHDVTAYVASRCPGAVVHGATLTGGDRATLTGGYRATLTGGHHATLTGRWWDGDRERLAVGYVGEDGLLPGVAYRLDGDHRFTGVAR